MPGNKQVWQNQPGEKGTIKDADLPAINERTLLVKVKTWAMNPCDSFLQDQALPFVQYPVILGQDIAGVVEQVGSIAAQKFKRGDRVFGFTVNNAFQEYAPVDHLLAAKIPDSVSFKEASVFPLCCTTASVSLFMPDHLALPLPSLQAKPMNQSILIWGGSSAVGSNSIQLAVGAGFTVYTTCSPRSFEYVKSLGAHKVFDYNSPTTIDEIVTELDKGTCAGIHVATGEVADACQVSSRSKQQLFVSSARWIKPDDCPEGVNAKMAFCLEPNDFIPVLPAIWNGYLVEALNKGIYKVAPAPRVLPVKGVEGIQVALDALKEGVSATKLVVEAS